MVGRLDPAFLRHGRFRLHPAHRPTRCQAHTAHTAFEREHFEGRDQRADTGDFLVAIEGTRRTLTEEMVDEFRRNSQEFARY